ncbi:MAG TPA: rhomboid family intramembrane serine protease [Gallionellaceae bacterium]
MFIIPVGNRVDWKRPPVITLLLILVNCFVFFFLQSGEDRQEQKAEEYYFSSDLPKWELNRYPEYLEKTGDFIKSQHFRKLLDRHDPRALSMMDEDAKFLRELRAGHVVTPDAPEYSEWFAQRKKFDSLRSFTTRYVFYVDSPTVLNAFTSAFMHGGLDHLFGNMVVLFLVGFLVESVIGRTMFILGYGVSIFTATAVFMVTAHGGASLGASGAIAGVMGMYTVIFGLRKIDFFYSLGFYFDYVRAPAIALLPLWLGNELYQFLSEKGAHVAYMAHFGGLLGGAVMGTLFRQVRPARIEEHHEAAESKEMDKETFKRGMDHLGAMEFKKALAVFKLLQEKHPDDLNLARLVYRAAKSDPASEDYHRAALRLLALPGQDENASGQVHTLFREYMSTAQPFPKLGHDLTAKLAKRFAAAGLCEDADKLAVYLLRSAPRHAELPAVLLALASGYYRSQNKDKFAATLHSLTSQFPESKEAETAARMTRLG